MGQVVLRENSGLWIIGADKFSEQSVYELWIDFALLPVGIESEKVERDSYSTMIRKPFCSVVD